jgi:DNA topoisomerase-1
VTFSEITESAIREAFSHPRNIDMHLVDAQQARRIVDRLVGYTLSPLLWRKVRGGLSAGRVQSVAVRLVVDREREIRAFEAREYWTLETLLETAAGDRFTAHLAKIDGKTAEIADGDAAASHATEIRATQPLIESIAKRSSRRTPAPPFTTSTLQQEASRKLGFNPRRTMRAAQSLYEGVETAEGQVGLITYMRTDSTAMASIAQREAIKVAGERYGSQFVEAKGRVYKTKSKGAQEAHEAIRPTSFARDPESLEGQVPADELRLYRLIWQRAIASQMSPKELETTTVDLSAGRYGLRPSQDWPHRQAWTAPAAWSAWSLAALDERSAALRLLGILRRDSTAVGTIPERVGPANGLPRSTTPLGWTHSFLALALRQVYRR